MHMALPGDTLSALGGDLTLSISLFIGNELVSGARDEGWSDTELVGIILVFIVLLSAVPLAVMEAPYAIASVWAAMWGRPPPPHPLKQRKGIASFIVLLTETTTQISRTVLVQVLARSVVAAQPLRSVRILTLAGVAIFFLFLESTSAIGRRFNSANGNVN